MTPQEQLQLSDQLSTKWTIGEALEALQQSKAKLNKLLQAPGSAPYANHESIKQILLGYQLHIEELKDMRMQIQLLTEKYVESKT